VVGFSNDEPMPTEGEVCCASVPAFAMATFLATVGCESCPLTRRLLGPIDDQEQDVMPCALEPPDYGGIPFLVVLTNDNSQ
jgi:hypothetical protein